MADRRMLRSSSRRDEEETEEEQDELGEERDVIELDIGDQLQVQTSPIITTPTQFDGNFMQIIMQQFKEMKEDSKKQFTEIKEDSKEIREDAKKRDEEAKKRDEKLEKQLSKLDEIKEDTKKQFEEIKEDMKKRDEKSDKQIEELKEELKKNKQEIREEIRKEVVGIEKKMTEEITEECAEAQKEIQDQEDVYNVNNPDYEELNNQTEKVIDETTELNKTIKQVRNEDTEGESIKLQNVENVQDHREELKETNAGIENDWGLSRGEKEKLNSQNRGFENDYVKREEDKMATKEYDQLKRAKENTNSKPFKMPKSIRDDNKIEFKLIGIILKLKLNLVQIKNCGYWILINKNFKYRKKISF